MDLGKKNQRDCLCLFTLWVIGVLPIFGALAMFGLRENVPDSSEEERHSWPGHSTVIALLKLTGDIGKGMEDTGVKYFEAHHFNISSVDVVITKLNSTYHGEERLFHKTYVVKLLFKNVIMLLILVQFLIIWLAANNLAAITFTPTTLQYLREFVQGIFQGEKDIFQPLFDDQLCECPNSPEPDVLPEQVLVKIV